MRDQYLAFVQQAQGRGLYERYTLLLSASRSLVQTVALCVFDILAHAGADRGALKRLAQRSWVDQDGAAVVALRELLGLAAREGRSPLADAGLALEALLVRWGRWVELRNDFCHGVPRTDELEDRALYLTSLIADTANAAAELLPEGTSGSVPVTRAGLSLYSFPHLVEPLEPIVFRKLDLVPPASVEAQRLRNAEARRVLLSQHSRLAALGRPGTTYETFYVPPWSVRARVPSRPQGFLFREEPLGELEKWWNDSSRKLLLIWGEGGLGKTSLVLEFLHQVLKGERVVVYRPELICFTTAKSTSFDAEGFAKFEQETSGLDDVALQVAEGLSLEPLWTRTRGKPRWDDLRRLVQEKGRDPAGIVVVVDNAETLTKKVQGAKTLGSELEHITRRGFRVIVTSRRQEELVDRLAIPLPPLSEQEAVSLARNLAAKDGVQAVTNAGSTTLKRAVSGALRCNPLLVATLVARVKAGRGIKDVTEEIARLGINDLARFLYEDAWQRWEGWQREIVAALRRLGPCSEEVVKAMCGPGKPFVELERALYETRFVDVTRGTFCDYAVTEWAERFIDDQIRTDNTLGDTARKLAEECLSSVHERYGRLPSKTSSTLAAHEAWRVGDYQQAHEQFEVALQGELKNVGLLKAFARCATEAGEDVRKAVLNHESTKKLEHDRETSLLLARVAAPVPSMGGRMRKYLQEAGRAGATEQELALVRVEHDLARLRSPDEFRVPKKERDEELALIHREIERALADVAKQVERLRRIVQEGESWRREELERLEVPLGGLERELEATVARPARVAG
jgi:hypothetical protein